MRWEPVLMRWWYVWCVRITLPWLPADDPAAYSRLWWLSARWSIHGDSGRVWGEEDFHSAPAVTADSHRTHCLTELFWGNKMNEWCFRPRFCTEAKLGQRQPGRMRWILLWIMPLVQDWSLDLLASNLACYHCTMAASSELITLYWLFW